MLCSSFNIKLIFVQKIIISENRLHLHHQKIIGGLAQLARAFDWQSKGHRFDSDILHQENKGVRELPSWALFYLRMQFACKSSKRMKHNETQKTFKLPFH